MLYVVCCNSFVIHTFKCCVGKTGNDLYNRKYFFFFLFLNFISCSLAVAFPLTLSPYYGKYFNKNYFKLYGSVEVNCTCFAVFAETQFVIEFLHNFRQFGEHFKYFPF